MSIHETLLNEIASNSENFLFNYGCDRIDIETFLLDYEPFINRQKRAINIIEKVLLAHGKEKLLSYLVELARVEHGIRELEPWVRDHVVHAVLSFILGIYFIEKFMKPSYPVDRFQWKISGLLHDIGYPVQIASDILQPFENTVNGIKHDLGVVAEEVRFIVIPKNLDKLSNELSSLNVIQSRLEDWNLNIDVELVYRHMIETGKVCHGMIGALAVLWIIDMMYKKFNPTRKYEDIYQSNSSINWNQMYFDDHVVSACSAIFIHNLNNKHFSTSKIDREIAPLAFLLKLSDTLQDWERPSLHDPIGIPAINYDIKVDNKKIIFEANLSNNKKQKIRNEINSCLIADDIRII